MKNVSSYLYVLAILICMSSCGYAINHCPTYSHHNQITSHGHKAQHKYHKKKVKRTSTYARSNR